MKIAICEDEKIHQNTLQGMLKKWAADSRREIDVSIFDNAEALLMLWEDVVFDVLILDIEMKKMSGMELAKTIRRIDGDVIIIFVTSHSSYSLEGYEVNPLHYLTKPLQEQKFFKVLDKAFAIYLLQGRHGLVINAEAGLQKIPPDTISYIAIYSHDAKVYTSGGLYLSRTTIKELSKTLPAHFVNCHRSYIVNMFKVDCVFSDHVIMTDGKEIPVSRANSKQVRELFIQLRTG
ncbi:LytTR family DNA-binding domain-containing protein [Lachnospiraceae bacterium ZAX-1]